MEACGHASPSRIFGRKLKMRRVAKGARSAFTKREPKEIMLLKCIISPQLPYQATMLPMKTAQPFLRTLRKRRWNVPAGNHQRRSHIVSVRDSAWSAPRRSVATRMKEKRKPLCKRYSGLTTRRTRPDRARVFSLLCAVDDRTPMPCRLP